MARKHDGLAHQKMMPHMDTYGGQEKPGYRTKMHHEGHPPVNTDMHMKGKGYVAAKHGHLSEGKYSPPHGSAGHAAMGVYGHKNNPMSVPYKGSQIKDAYGNADTMKAQRNKDEQLYKENLRGQAS